MAVRHLSRGRAWTGRIEFAVVLVCVLVSARSLGFAEGRVAISEILYNAPNDLDTVEFVEIHNYGDGPVDLSGWKFSQGVAYRFPPETEVAPGAFVVICADAAALGEHFPNVEPLGEYDGTLANGGELLELADAEGNVVDRVEYNDRAPWPTIADGYGASLERIVFAADGNEPSAWGPSPAPGRERRPSGSPGKANSVSRATLAIGIAAVEIEPSSPRPGKPVSVRVQLPSAEASLVGITLRHQTIAEGKVRSRGEVALEKTTDREWTGTIPPQPEGELVRFFVEVRDAAGATHRHPSEHALRPTYSYVHFAVSDAGRIPAAHILHSDRRAYLRARSERKRAGRRGGGPIGAMIGGMIRSNVNLTEHWKRHFAEGAKALSENEYRALRSAYRESGRELSETIETIVVAGNFRERFGDGYRKEIDAVFSSHLERVRGAIGEERAKTVEGAPPRGDGRQGFRGGADDAFTPDGLRYFLEVDVDLEYSQLQALRSVHETAAEGWRKLGSGGPAGLVGRFLGGRGRGRRIDPDRAAAYEEEIRSTLKETLSSTQLEQVDEWLATHSMTSGGGSRSPFGGPPAPPPPSRGSSAFVLVSPDRRSHETYDYVHLQPRRGGYKVRFHKDRELSFPASERPAPVDLRTINLLFEENPRFVLAEHLGYAVYERAGAPSPFSDHVRVIFDGDTVGYYLVVEQVNRAFLRRHGRDDNGDLFKILWYERGVENKHEKKTNPSTGHKELIELIEALESTKGDEQWELIAEKFNVPEMSGYFVASMCTSNWDGFFNNYFTYHDTGGTGKWEMYPWDEDKTWGFYDGIGRDHVFVDMPITFGMTGDVPPGRSEAPRGFGFGGRTPWWRGPGYFSGPLLANPTFRLRFLQRLVGFTSVVYTEGIFGPIIDGLEERLEDEVAIRARATGEDEERALTEFQHNLKSLRRHLRERREFLLAQPELRPIIRKRKGGEAEEAE